MFTGVAVRADDLSLRGGHGWVYREVTAEAAPGALTAVAGQAGSGRTSLLLTLAGRMKPTAGTLTVAGRHTPRTIRRVAALGLVDGVNDLDPALSVAEHLRERARGPLGSRRGGRQETRAGVALELAGLERSPGDRTLVRALDREQRVRLGLALALLDEPGLLVLDNVDTGLDAVRRAALWATLTELAALGLTVFAACTEPPEPPQAGGTLETTTTPGAAKARPVGTLRLPGQEER
ncbi:ATP-binding cassette domain-containing protein [Streptosporangium jomthongense]|uniref:ATP-binding cassette domain-containing protein n=1 Tax=Streptosporangium jomthongense TaxID=1193683 RepID=A0ABV8F761_9ACTN